MSLSVPCTERLQCGLKLHAAYTKCGQQERWTSGCEYRVSRFWRKHATWAAPAPSDYLGRQGAREGAGSSLIAVFSPSSLPGELSREKQGEDGRALFFGVRQRRRLQRRWQRQRLRLLGLGSCCRGHLSSSSPQRARVPPCLGESQLFFLREMRLSRARGRSGSSCCAGGSRPPL